MTSPRRAATAAATLAAACLLTPFATTASAMGSATGFAGEEVTLGASQTEARASGADDDPTPWGAVTALLGGSAVMAAAGAFSLGRYRPRADGSTS